MKSSLLEKRIEKFFENTTELLTDIHARNNSEKKGGNKGKSKKGRRKKKNISIPDPDMDLLDEGSLGL